ncbi:MAG: hypothetical protein EOM50_07185 [Erysipelotrichia bacterium]|nr:hypothetical protein [Erysipelotrichia bacterium]NCC54285.1 hypothetical protein [Erysipelotrichia bacterium]
MKKWNWKSITLTMVLLCVLIACVYALIAFNITGPYYMGQSKSEKVIEKIKQKEKQVVSIKRHSFQYITYTCETKNKYIIYNEKGEKILTRSKKDLQLDKVKAIVNESYPELADEEIQISYGYKNAVYLLEDDQYTMLMLDFDKLKEVFYMKEKE